MAQNKSRRNQCVFASKPGSANRTQSIIPCIIGTRGRIRYYMARVFHDRSPSKSLHRDTNSLPPPSSLPFITPPSLQTPRHLTLRHPPSSIRYGHAQTSKNQPSTLRNRQQVANMSYLIAPHANKTSIVGLCELCLLDQPVQGEKLQSTTHPKRKT